MKKIKCLILAGGLSQRMGEDKSLINYFGIDQALYLYKMAESTGLETYISHRASADQKEKFQGLKTIEDKFSISGPMNGILSALKSEKETSWLVIGCDLPLVKKKHILEIIQKHDFSKVATTYLSIESELAEPMFTIYNPSFVSAAEEYLAKDKKCPRKVLINTDTLDLKQEEGFLTNVNFPEDREQVINNYFKSVTVKYFAAFRDDTKKSEEVIKGVFDNSEELFDQLSLLYKIGLSKKSLKVAVNEEYQSFETVVKNNDVVAFIPPVAGG